MVTAIVLVGLCTDMLYNRKLTSTYLLIGALFYLVMLKYVEEINVEVMPTSSMCVHPWLSLLRILI